MKGADERGLEFARSIGASSIASLRERSVAELLKAATGDVLSIAHVDGWFLPDQVATIFSTGKQHHVPMLLGWNANEGEIAVPPAFSLAMLREHEQRHYGSQAGALERLYPAATDDQARRAYMDYVGDLLVGFPMRTLARLHTRSRSSPAFVYRFEHTAPDAPTRGAHHGAEVTYAFHNVELSRRPFNDAGRQLSDTMSSYLVQFARTGNPNASGLPSWPAYDDRETLLALGDPIEARPLPRKDALDFFSAFFANPK